MMKKYSIEDKIIVSAIGCIVFISFLAFDSCSQRKARIAAEGFNTLLISEAKKRIDDQKVYYINRGKKHEARADSAVRVIGVLKTQWKTKNSYYINKLKSVEKVTTYSARQRYADSLASSMR